MFPSFMTKNIFDLLLAFFWNNYSTLKIVTQGFSILFGDNENNRTICVILLSKLLIGKGKSNLFVITQRFLF